MYEEKIAWVDFKSTENALLEADGRIQEPLQVCPLPSEWNSRVIRKEPIEDGEKHLI